MCSRRTLKDALHQYWDDPRGLATRRFRDRTVPPAYGGRSPKLPRSNNEIFPWNWLKAPSPLSLAHSDPAAIADSICAIEETLALAKVVAGTLRWTPGLTTMTRRAIGALRKVVISKPDADFCTNASFLRALEQAPHCARIVAALIEADDRSVRRGVEQAVAAISSAVGLKKIHGWATSNMLGKDRSEENFGFVVCGKRVGFRQVGMPPLRSANDVSAPRISSS